MFNRFSIYCKYIILGHGLKVVAESPRGDRGFVCFPAEADLFLHVRDLMAPNRRVRCEARGCLAVGKKDTKANKQGVALLG